MQHVIYDNIAVARGDVNAIFSHSATWLDEDVWRDGSYLRKMARRRTWATRMGEGLATLGHFVFLDLYLWVLFIQEAKHILLTYLSNKWKLLNRENGHGEFVVT